jgi:hypothetical protein
LKVHRYLRLLLIYVCIIWKGHRVGAMIGTGSFNSFVSVGPGNYPPPGPPGIVFVTATPIYTANGTFGSPSVLNISVNENVVTARNSYDVGPTIYYITIFDITDNKYICVAGSGTTCQVTLLYSGAGHNCTAFVSSVATVGLSSPYPPRTVILASAYVTSAAGIFTLSPTSVPTVAPVSAGTYKVTLWFQSNNPYYANNHENSNHPNNPNNPNIPNKPNN